jgi:hypothetical protein
MHHLLGGRVREGGRGVKLTQIYILLQEMLDLNLNIYTIVVIVLSYKLFNLLHGVQIFVFFVQATNKCISISNFAYP